MRFPRLINTISKEMTSFLFVCPLVKLKCNKNTAVRSQNCSEDCSIYPDIFLIDYLKVQQRVARGPP